MLATASTTRGWLCVEEPGPWGAGTVPETRIGAEVTASLRTTAEAASSRLLLIRRPGSLDRRPDGDRTLYRVRCRRGAAQVQVRTCSSSSVAEAAADEAGWRDHTGPLLLVCTHGRKDWCCAMRGRPTAVALAERAPEATWECTHLGGDRFAATVLSLPDGCFYGRVGTGDVEELLASVRAGRVPARMLRGRCTDAVVVQAADVHARLVLGRQGLDDLIPTAAHRLDELTWRITLADAVTGGPVEVTVRQTHVEPAQRLTCGAGQEQHARTWELVDLQAPAPAAP